MAITKNNTRMLEGTLGVDKLSATGTKDATTFLRGDNTFAAPAAPSVGNSPYFNGKKASDQTITRNTMTTVTGFTNGEIDSDSAFDGTTFTVPSGKAGVYFFSALVTNSFNTVGSDGERCLVTFMKNGSDSNMPSSDFTKASGYN